MSPAIGLVALVALAASFEGELELQLRSSAGNGQVKVTLAPHAMRSDVEGTFLSRALKSTLLVRSDAPDVGVALDPVRKTWQRFSLAEAADAMRPQQSRSLRVERLGAARVLDFACERVRVSDGPGFVAEYWIARDALLDDGLAAVVNRAAKQPASVEAALWQAGLKGLVLKLEQQSGADRVSLELVKATSRRAGAEAFEIPAGFREVASALGPGASLRQVARFESLSEAEKKALSQRLRENAQRSPAR